MRGCVSPASARPYFSPEPPPSGPGLLRTPGWLLLGALLLAVPATAAEHLLRLLPDSTAIRFTLGATLHKVRGSARLLEGEIYLDLDGGPARGRIRIDAQSAGTGRRRRDRKMHREVLESEKYPEIVFRPDSAFVLPSASGYRTLAIEGRILLHGTEHPLLIPAELETGESRVHFRGRFRVPYVEWGLKNPSRFFLRVARIVEVEIEGTAALDPPAGP